ncbi:MAG TPA: hypothetical protein VNU44_20665 [Bryobacteraceae bacterium]|jgi:hypothetical protein|nr:hypothetical protein [Bryobacteraceae bacterium]
MLARFRRIWELIALWEMRLKGKDGISRALYVTAVGRRDTENAKLGDRSALVDAEGALLVL